jgi:hypothetical protein
MSPNRSASGSRRKANLLGRHAQLEAERGALEQVGGRDARLQADMAHAARSNFARQDRLLPDAFAWNNPGRSTGAEA